MFLIGIISVIAIVYGLVGFILNQRKDRKPLPGTLPAIAAGIVLLSLLSIIVKVGPQEVGIQITPNGVKDEELHSGWHLVAPWNSVRMMDKTEWVYTFSAKHDEGNKAAADAIWAPTKDGIKMGFDLSISWKIDPNYASWIYTNISEGNGGENSRYLWIEENIIRTKAKSALALTVSNYTPIEVYSTKREEIQNTVFKRLVTEMANKHLTLEQVDIREVSYNPEYETAINNKKLAEQEALRLVEVTKQKEEQLKQASIEKDIAIQKAEGESKALQIKGQSISSNPKIIQLEWIQKWNGQLPTYMMGDKSGVLLNVGGKE